MIRSAALAAAAALLASAALAQTAAPDTPIATAPAPRDCVRPTPPPPIDGAASTMPQIVEAQEAVKAFIAASDRYQTCLVEEVTAKRAEAKAARAKFDGAIAKDADARIAQNQKDKESTGKTFNDAVKAFKAANPR